MQAKIPHSFVRDFCYFAPKSDKITEAREQAGLTAARYILNLLITRRFVERIAAAGAGTSQVRPWGAGGAAGREPRESRWS